MIKLLSKLILIAFNLIPLLMVYDKTCTAGWTKMNSGTSYPLRDVWGSSASDIFAVGSGGIKSKNNFP